MNRQYKRALKKDQARKTTASRPSAKAAAAAQGKKQRTKPRQFVKEVVGELQKVAWPTRQEVASYSLVVLVSSIVIAALIFVMDYIFTKGVLTLFGIET